MWSPHLHTNELNIRVENVLFVREFFWRRNPWKSQKVSVFSYFLSNITLSTAKKFPNKQHIGEWQIGSSVTHTKKIRKIAGFFFEKKTWEICVLKTRLRETMRNIRNGMLQKKSSKFILCSLVARHHSMKVLCNFDHYWWRKNFLDEKHVFWNP